MRFVSFSAPRAYIDPNTGGMLFQILAVFLALFSGIIFFFSRQIKTFAAKVRRRFRNEDPHPMPNQDQTNDDA
jgi:hypothetical protein